MQCQLTGGENESTTYSLSTTGSLVPVPGMTWREAPSSAWCHGRSWDLSCSPDSPRPRPPGGHSPPGSAGSLSRLYCRWMAARHGIYIFKSKTFPAVSISIEQSALQHLRKRFMKNDIFKYQYHVWLPIFELARGDGVYLLQSKINPAKH